MIIFYNKKNGEIIGTIEGRVHTEDQLKMFIQPSNVPKKDIGKYIIPFKVIYKEQEEPIFENRIVDTKTLKVDRVVVGKKKVKIGVGMEPDVLFKDLILDFEKGKKKIFDYKVDLKTNKLVKK
jgi:hypothetical protein